MVKNRLPETETKRSTLYLGRACYGILLALGVASLALAVFFLDMVNNPGEGEGAWAGVLTGAVFSAVFIVIGAVTIVLGGLIARDVYRAKKLRFGVFPYILILISGALIAVLVRSLIDSDWYIGTVAVYLGLMAILVACVVYAVKRILDRSRFKENLLGSVD